jgi:Tol biopolymer transport system component
MPDRVRELLASGLIVLLGATEPAWAADITHRVSVGANSVQGSDDSTAPAFSAGGRFVAFASDAGNLVANDTNDDTDVFVRDRHAGTTERVSVGRNGAQGDDESYLPSISADGRLVAFVSDAENLVPGDRNDSADVFVHDRRARTTVRVSGGSGRSEADSDSLFAAISADGRFVAFVSDASNLVPGDTNGSTDVFVFDRETGRTERVSVGRDSAEGNGVSLFPVAISAGGRFVAFPSNASNLVPGDTNGVTDVFVRDRRTRRTERISVGQGGAQANGVSFAQAISADGRFVVFYSYASNLVPNDTNRSPDVFVHDRRTRTTTRVSVARNGAQANNASDVAAISADGRYVTFRSDASNLVPGDTNGTGDVFLRDRRTGRIDRVSVARNGAQANGDSIHSAILADGRLVAFTSDAGNLVPSDTNASVDVFVRER